MSIAGTCSGGGLAQYAHDNFMQDLLQLDQGGTAKVGKLLQDGYDLCQNWYATRTRDAAASVTLGDMRAKVASIQATIPHEQADITNLTTQDGGLTSNLASQRKTMIALGVLAGSTVLAFLVLVILRAFGFSATIRFGFAIAAIVVALISAGVLYKT